MTVEKVALICFSPSKWIACWFDSSHIRDYDNGPWCMCSTHRRKKKSNVDQDTCEQKISFGKSRSSFERWKSEDFPIEIRRASCATWIFKQEHAVSHSKFGKWNDFEFLTANLHMKIKIYFNNSTRAHPYACEPESQKGKKKTKAKLSITQQRTVA